MTFDEYMEKTVPTVKYPNIGKNIYYPTMGLAGEAGEVANKVKKIMRDDANMITLEAKQKIADELGDCLWYIAAICRELNISMSYAAERNLVKLRSRLERGTILGGGDDR